MTTFLIALITIYALGTLAFLAAATIVQAFLDRTYGMNGMKDGFSEFREETEDMILDILEWPLLLVYVVFYGITHLVMSVVGAVKRKLFNDGPCLERCDAVCEFEDDFVDELIAERSENNPTFPDFVDAYLDDDIETLPEDYYDEEPTQPAAIVPKATAKKSPKKLAKKSPKKAKK